MPSDQEKIVEPSTEAETNDVSAQLTDFRKKSEVLNSLGGYFEYKVSQQFNPPSELFKQFIFSGQKDGEVSLDDYVDHIREDYREKVKTHLADVLMKGIPLNILVPHVSATGEETWLQIRGDHFVDSEGTRWVTGLTTNVTQVMQEKHELERLVSNQARVLSHSEEKFVTIVEDSSEIIVILNRDRQILYVNRVLESLKLEDVLGSTAESYVPEEYQQIVIDSVEKAFVTGESVNYEIPVLGEHGDRTWFYSRTSPMKANGEVVAVSIISRDVTQSHMYQVQIEQLNQSLEERVAEQTKELSSLLASATELMTGLEANPIFQSAVSAITETLPSILEAVVWLYDSDNSLFVRVASSLRAEGGSSIKKVDDRLRPLVEELGSIFDQEICYPHDVDMSWAFSSPFQDDDFVAGLSISENSFGHSILLFRGKKDPEPLNSTSIQFLKSLAAQTAVGLNNVDLYEQLRQLSIRLLHIQEEERRTIAIELHDQLGGLITSLKMELEGAPASESTQRAIGMLEMLGSSARSLSKMLRPSTLDDFGIIAAVEELIPHNPGATTLRHSLEHNLDEEERFPPSVETVTYRVIQESVTNVLRHSKADFVSISLTKSGKQIDIVIEDNGTGFVVSSDSTPDSNSLGLKGMQERIALIGGSFEVASVPGTGTIVTASIPTDLDPWV